MRGLKLEAWLFTGVVSKKVERSKSRGTNMSTELCSERSPKPSSKKEMLPKIVQLGATIPVKRKQADDTWMPILTEPKVTSSSSNMTSQTTKCQKFKNLFEYNKKYNDKFNLKRNLWKIPSMGNNFLPFQKKGDPDSADEATGLYRPNFQNWYSRLVHENTVILPPIETSGRVRENFHEPTNLLEKKYILKQMKNTGPRERFLRDEIHLPDVYSQCFTCKECQREYVNDVYVQTWKQRNDVTPLCTVKTRHGESGRRASRKKQHCDVLGERYCRACIERRNKNFSLNIENKLARSKDMKSVHYRNTII